MRIVGILLLVFISINNYSFAQSKCDYKLYSKLGIQAGGPLYHSETIVSKKGSPGFNSLAGIGATYKLYKGLAISFEVFYSRRKINYSSDVVNQFYNDTESNTQTVFTGKTKGSFNMNFLELPLFLQYSLSKKVTIQAGAYYAWAFNRTNKGTATGIVGRTDIPDPSYIENKEYDNSSQLNVHYWGALAGVQYNICSRIKADFRMTYSFTSLYDENWPGVDYTLKDLYGQLSINYIISQNKR